MSKVTSILNSVAGLAAVLMLSFSLAAQAGTRVEGVRVWPAPDHTRLVLDTAGKVAHNVFSLQNPARLVIDQWRITYSHCRTLRAWSLT